MTTATNTSDEHGVIKLAIVVLDNQLTGRSGCRGVGHMQTHVVGTANLIEWAKLGLKELPARVLRATLIRHDDSGCAVEVQYVVLPLDRFPALVPNGGDLSDVVDLARRHGLSLGRASERIGIVPADGDVAQRFGIIAGTSVLKQDRVTECAEGEPLEWRIVYTRA